MSSNHILNKAKADALLREKGWKRGLNKEWIVPDSATNLDIEEHWTEAILASIECKFEHSLEENKAFLRKHPRQERT